MSLNKARLKSDLKSILTNSLVNGGTVDNALDTYAGDIADAIDRYVKGAQINYTAGLTSPSGNVGGVFNGTLS